MTDTTVAERRPEEVSRGSGRQIHAPEQDGREANQRSEPAMTPRIDVLEARSAGSGSRNILATLRSYGRGRKRGSEVAKARRAG
jgi:hypothetical protein